ncbi:MAG: DUF2203 domain-containing protein [Gemmataceae bacterium]|nr:DUF2203 domain-containing protein [Gemmataceae bacterium]MDW8264171.1 DUF2203 domain-containing protein [Gemmataceae bacterium]
MLGESASSCSRRFFTPAEANRMLPLVRRIVQDIVDLAVELRERHERLQRLTPQDSRVRLSPSHAEEVAHAQAELERGQERMQELIGELTELGVELKDYFLGLVDFPSLMDGREVYLCWKLGEPEVAHWHDLDKGFAGRQKLPTGGDATSPKSKVGT